jgi:hypothetical protein
VAASVKLKKGGNTMGRIETSRGPVTAPRVGRLFFAFCLLFLPAGPAGANYGGGSGTADNPYLIYTAEQMNTVGLHKEDWDKHFKLMADLDLSAYKGDNFNLIGIDHPKYWSEITPFTGVFDGNGHTIANFTYAVSKGEPDRTLAPWAIREIGVFRYVYGKTAEIKNLGLIDPNLGPARDFTEPISIVGALIGKLRDGSVTDCYVEGGWVSGHSTVGGLVGICYQGTISRCHARCRITCPQMEPQRLSIAGETALLADFGGLSGSNQGATIADCWAGGTVQGYNSTGGLVGNMMSYGGADITRAVVTSCRSTAGVSGDDYVGGLVGDARGDSEISSSCATGTVSGQHQVGGLVGHSRDRTTICRSYAAGDVSGDSYIGGLAGQSESGIQISDCYATGDTSGPNYIGGLVGHMAPMDGGIEHCYATGRVTGTMYIGGLVGYMNGSPTYQARCVLGSFWGTETSGQSTSAGGTGMTTAEMQSIWTYIQAGWDFVGEPYNGVEDLWRSCCGRPMYPKLAWEPTLAGDFVGPEGVDFRDLMLLAQHWLKPVWLPCESGDLTLDARVDLNDFAVLAQWWRRGARKVVYETTLDTAPDWQTQGQWQFGPPAGRGGSEHGSCDPTGGYTGPNVYGVNLSGDYAIATDGPHYLTAGPFDCRRYHDVQLQFARWLNTDEADFVRAMLETSVDGTTWMTVWEHADVGKALTDSDWQMLTYSLSPSADNQPSVYIRWGYEVLDREAWAFSGWNIDDVVILGCQ